MLDIKNDVNIRKFIDSIYDNKEQSNKLKLILESKIDNSFNNIKQVLLIGEMKFKSISSIVDKLLYADPTKLSYKVSYKDGKIDKINIFDDENNFYIKSEDAKNTVALIRSGYKNQLISYLCKQLKEIGVLVINDPECVSISNDKYLTALNLEKYSISQPKFVLVESDDIHKGDSKKLDEKLKKIYKESDDDTKYVCKLLGGHGGKGVFLCRKSNITSVLQCIFAIDKECKILVQEKLDIKDGDIRAHVITIKGKQKIIDVTLREKGSNDFRTNLSLGNHQKENYKLTPEQETIVKETAKASGLIWCGVDLLQTDSNKNYVIEYNGAPGPPSDMTTDQEELLKNNEEFYLKLLNTIDDLL